MADKSQESLYLQSLGDVRIRGLTTREVALLWRSALRSARGNKSAFNGMLLVGCLSLGISRPRLNRDEVEMFVKRHAKEAALVAERIISLTMSVT